MQTRLDSRMRPHKRRSSEKEPGEHQMTDQISRNASELPAAILRRSLRAAARLVPRKTKQRAAGSGPGRRVAHWVARHNPPPETVRKLSELLDLSEQDIRSLIKHPGPPRPVWVGPLRREVLVRPGTSDIFILGDTFIRQLHLPPNDFPPPDLILDLGAHIGTTMLDLAGRFADASILGVELDASNHALCINNLAPVKHRCRVIHGAITGAHKQSVAYTRSGSPRAHHSYRVSDRGEKRVRVVTLDSLLPSTPPPNVFVKMDIEGSEKDVFSRDMGWADAISCISVEVHDPGFISECESRLSQLGFSTRRGKGPRVVIGIKSASRAISLVQ